MRMGNKVLNEKDVLRKYTEDGMTQNDIAKEYHVAVVQIRKILKKNNIDTRLNSKTKAEVEQQIYEQICQYRRISEISKDLNVTRDVVRRVADNHNIDVVQYRNLYYEKKVIDMVNNNESYASIMRKLNVSLSFIKDTIEKNNIGTPMENKALKVKEMRKNGYGIVKISQELAMSTRTVHKILESE